MLNLNGNFTASISVHTQIAFTVPNQLFQFSRFADTNHSKNFKFKYFKSRVNHEQTIITRHGLTSIQTDRSQIPQWQSNPAYFPPINFASFNDFPTKTQPPPKLTVSEVRHQVIPSAESYTFRRVENEKVYAIRQTLGGGKTHDTECQTSNKDEEDTPLFRKNMRKVMDIELLAASTKRDRNLSPLMNMVKQHRWDNIKECYCPYFSNVRHHLSVRDNILLYDDKVVIPKQLRATLMDALHLTRWVQGGTLEAAKHVWYPNLHRDNV